MAELKTQKNNASVSDFIKAADPDRQKDCQALLKIFSDATKEKPVMWGTSIIGFGTYHYKSERSSQEGDWFLAGFSPRKQNLTLYIIAGTNNYPDLLKKLGKHKASSGSCIYINRLSDIDTDVLKELIKTSVEDMRKRYSVK